MTKSSSDSQKVETPFFLQKTKLGTFILLKLLLQQCVRYFIWCTRPFAILLFLSSYYFQHYPVHLTFPELFFCYLTTSPTVHEDFLNFFTGINNYKSSPLSFVKYSAFVNFFMHPRVSCLTNWIFLRRLVVRFRTELFLRRLVIDDCSNY